MIVPQWFWRTISVSDVVVPESTPQLRSVITSPVSAVKGFVCKWVWFEIILLTDCAVHFHASDRRKRTVSVLSGAHTIAVEMVDELASVYVHGMKRVIAMRVTSVARLTAITGNCG